MDTEDINILFNSEGVCNHCEYYDDVTSSRLNKTHEDFESIIEEIKINGKDKKYDAIIGLSGGADSSYVAYLVKKFDLRLLAVHLDNGWNSREAVQNIKACLEWLGCDLYTHVIDWNEFRDMQKAYLKAGVIDIEALTDHAIRSLVYRLAHKFKVKYLLSGQNLATESIMPSCYGYSKVDSRNIKAIHKRFGELGSKTFPYTSLGKLIYYKLFVKIETVRVLDFYDYNRELAIELMENDMGWQDYGGKHYESIFTKFYQSYILPKKFGKDKRKPHLSSMINSGMMTKAEALNRLETPTFDKNQINNDLDYVARKFNFDPAELRMILSEKPKSHLDYPNNYRIINLLLSLTSSKSFVKARKNDSL
jgi:N-acetyl sugar amidotransferase